MGKENSNQIEMLSTATLKWNDVLRVLGSIAGFVGIAGSLLWLFGRSYYSGLLSAFGFSYLSISLAPEDYLEKGVARLIYFIIDVLIAMLLYYLAYLARNLYHEKVNKQIKNRVLKITLILILFSVCTVGGVFLISTIGLGLFTSYFFENPINLAGMLIMFFGLETTYLIASPTNTQDNSPKEQSQFVISPQTPISVARVLILVVIFTSLLFTQAEVSFVRGQGEGCQVVLRKSNSVVIFSTENLLAEGQSKLGDLYKHDGYFLLFVDNDNYYLFRDINLETYKPNSFYVVNKSVLKTIQISELTIPEDENDKLNEICVKKINSN